MKQLDSDFVSGGTRCAAWLFLPDGVGDGLRPPIVVMAHGLSGQREMGLSAFAERFTSCGIAALVFDYRCFGASDGAPRNLIDPRRQLEDWRAAIDHARTLSEVDGSRLGLWGTSFSGGHVLATAAALDGISAVVSQVPFVGAQGENAPPVAFGQAIQLLGAAVLDVIRNALGASPYYVRVAGRPDELALLNAPDAMEGFTALIPPDSTWRNRAPARVLFALRGYLPLENAAQIACPVLLVAAEDDTLIPIAAVDAAAEKIPHCEYVRLPDTGHFEPYTGDVFERVVDLEAEFLRRHLVTTAG